MVPKFEEMTGSQKVECLREFIEAESGKTINGWIARREEAHKESEKAAKDQAEDTRKKNLASA